MYPEEEFLWISQSLPLRVKSSFHPGCGVSLALKAEFKTSKKISYANCFAAALAKLQKAELVTGDIKFKQVEGKVKILWI